jgi:hypothetical protein
MLIKNCKLHGQQAHEEYKCIQLPQLHANYAQITGNAEQRMA